MYAPFLGIFPLVILYLNIVTWLVNFSLFVHH